MISTNRWRIIMAILLLANICLFFVNLLIGERNIPFDKAFQILLGLANTGYEFTMLKLRLPRALVAALVGSGLALSGVILQAITRNPLASPSILGLNAGAAAAVVAILVLIPAVPSSLLPPVAFGGALVVAFLIYALSWRKGSSPIRLMLVGIGISAMANAVIAYLLTVSDIVRVTQAAIWMAGSLYGRGWEHFWPLLPWFMVLFPVAYFLARHLDLFQLGDPLAIGLGIHLERTRGLLILISVAIAGASVSAAGTIGFVGLMAPHMSRHLVGNTSARLLPVAALTGSLLVLSADAVGKILFPPYEIPVGIITAIIGAPYLFYLLVRQRK
ncbi:iron ABC transporter permease [uncultured Brevibacillus sp.]|uniref:FecCD family ABC transporter permease n=1 Tax=uncultured Brevibacillus sp. TaxID=169970 RepID=UPI002595C081|nr:iron ABC transporter permease [uncultured Brevibacillus sp.]